MSKEEDLHFVWKHGLFIGKPLKTTNGLALNVIHPGAQNFHAGPDFFNARIRLDQLVWAGNVEIHRFASDWNRHGHQLDPAYDNVILHVIQYFDTEIKNSKGRQIQTLVVSFSDSLLDRAEELRKNECWLPCKRTITQVPDSILKSWLHKLSIERLEEKKAYITNLLIRYRNDREQALYLAMASGFGLPINSLPFEMLASGIPLPLLMELRDNPNDLEALLFGHSGILHTVKKHDPYTRSLVQRYAKLKKTLPGFSLPPHLWKFLRIRPASFPTLRLSQFAALIHTQFPWAENFIRARSISDLENKLLVYASEYWNTHYTFGSASPFLKKKFGRQAIHHLLINVFLPFLEVLQQADPNNRTSTLEQELINNLEAESNYIIKNWSKFGVSPSNAFESQALIQLYKGYCSKKRCLDCQIGRGFSE